MNRDHHYFVHESSYVDENVLIGKRTKVWHFSHIQSGAVIGNNCTIGQNVNIGNNVVMGNYVKIQNNVSIYEGVELEDYVFCGPSMVFTNILLPRSEFPQVGSKYYQKTLVKKSATIAANATIICGVTIGKYALIGAGLNKTISLDEIIEPANKSLLSLIHLLCKTALVFSFSSIIFFSIPNELSNSLELCIIVVHNFGFIEK